MQYTFFIVILNSWFIKFVIDIKFNCIVINFTKKIPIIIYIAQSKLEWCVGKDNKVVSNASRTTQMMIYAFTLEAYPNRLTQGCNLSFTPAAVSSDISYPDGIDHRDPLGVLQKLSDCWNSHYFYCIVSAHQKTSQRYSWLNSLH